MERAEIFTYNTKEPVYAMHWSVRPQRDFRLALGSFKFDKSNFVEVIELDKSTGSFKQEPRLWTEHGFPPTKIMFSPESVPVDLVATSSDSLRLFRLTPDQGLRLHARLHLDKTSLCSKSLTSFDWKDPNLIATCSIDHSCTIWNIERQVVEKRILAHNDEVTDIAWGNSGRFATVSTDGSVRIFDMNFVANTNVYENSSEPLVRVSWNRQDDRYLAILAKDSRFVTILDTRYGSVPVAILNRHKAPVNGMVWAPHSSCHICTVGDDGQALIWDLKGVSQPAERNLDAILSYSSGSEISQVHWSSGKADWIAVGFDYMAQILQV